MFRHVTEKHVEHLNFKIMKKLVLFIAFALIAGFGVNAQTAKKAEVKKEAPAKVHKKGAKEMKADKKCAKPEMKPEKKGQKPAVKPEKKGAKPEMKKDQKKAK